MVTTQRTDIHPPPVTAAWLVQSADAESHTTYTGEVKQGRVVLCARQQVVGGGGSGSSSSISRFSLQKGVSPPLGGGGRLRSETTLSSDQ